MAMTSWYHSDTTTTLSLSRPRCPFVVVVSAQERDSMTAVMAEAVAFL